LRCSHVSVFVRYEDPVGALSTDGADPAFGEGVYSPIIGRHDRPLGRTLREPLKALTEWSLRHTAKVLAAREQYDGRANSVS
jgi:hypothetical protein